MTKNQVQYIQITQHTGGWQGKPGGSAPNRIDCTFCTCTYNTCHRELIDTKKLRRVEQAIVVSNTYVAVSWRLGYMYSSHSRIVDLEGHCRSAESNNQSISTYCCSGIELKIANEVRTDTFCNLSVHVGFFLLVLIESAASSWVGCIFVCICQSSSLIRTRTLMPSFGGFFVWFGVECAAAKDAFLGL